MKSKKLGIQDIAVQLKLSKTTVSFVLNGNAEKKGISAETQKRVLEHIETVGYIPSRLAQGLRTGRSRTIGMLIEDISDTFFSAAARRFEEVLAAKGYRIIYGSTENNTAITRDLIQVFRNHQVDGYIIAPPENIENDISDLVNDGIPVVIFDRPLKDMDTHCVLVENYQGTITAMNHLLGNGYRKIAMVTLDSDQMQMKERERGYNECMRAFSSQPVIKRFIYHEKPERVIAELGAFFKSNPDLEAVFFMTNYLAENGLEAITQLKIDIATELAVVVFDDTNLLRLFKPSVTAISQPVDLICDKVVQLMLEQLENRTVLSPRTIQLPVTLNIRDSSPVRYGIAANEDL